MFEIVDYDNHKVYACKVTMKDYIKHKDGKAFDRVDYLNNPEKYTSVFHEKVFRIRHGLKAYDDRIDCSIRVNDCEWHFLGRQIS